MVTTSNPGISLRRFQKTLDFIMIEKRDHIALVSFRGNRQDLLDEIDVFGYIKRYVMEEGTNCRQALISTPNTNTTGFLKMGKKACDELCIQIFQFNACSGLMVLFLCVMQQQRKTITVRSDRVPARLPLDEEILTEELLH
jgi:hypothetical protein